MSVTFFAIDHQGAIMKGLEAYELDVSNLNATRIELMLGFRAQGDTDIPAGERSVNDFISALFAAVQAGSSLGEYASRLDALCLHARDAGADVIAWA